MFLLIGTTFLAAFLFTAHIRSTFSCRSAEIAEPGFASLLMRLFSRLLPLTSPWLKGEK